MATLIDSYSESNADRNTGMGEDGGTAAFQSFVGDGKTLTSAKFYLGRESTLNGTIVAKLYASTGTHGSSAVPTGSALDTSNTLTGSDIVEYPPDRSLKEFTFSGGYTLQNGTVYCISIEYSIAFDTGFLYAGVDGSSPTHAGNSGVYYSTTGWTAYPASDLCFYVYGDAPIAHTQSYEVRHTATHGSQSKNTASYSNPSKNTSSWVSPTRATTTFNNQSKNSSSWSNQNKS